MDVRHYFLLAPGAPEPARWREAFPGGRALEEGALHSELLAPGRQDGLVWLSASDLAWNNHLGRLLQACPGQRVVLLSNEPHDQEGLRAMDDGAVGYAHAYAVPELLHEVALVVSHGGLWVGPTLIQRLLAATRTALERRPQGPPPPEAAEAVLAQLSAREAEVARCVAEGHTNKEVARLLDISERTVKAHLGAIFEKLGVRDRLQLVLRLSAGTPQQID